MIGTVGLVSDTLPEAVTRPFAQFSSRWLVSVSCPHHIGEWFGWTSTSTTFWYIACAALLLASLLAALAWQQGDSRCEKIARLVTFVVAFGVGMVPAFAPPEDSSTLFTIHPAAATYIVPAWEPVGRDRITRLREEAERYGSRGRGPCLWYRLADLERVMNQPGPAARDEARAKSAIPKEQCPKVYF